ncbi:MAG: hypothetical protein H6621_05190 [Halobacteriovoraceae bacterium]|nr:hypothetical protein [Halobacteriovoraceae bacterium]
MKKFLVLFILFFVYIENKSYAILAFEDAAFPEFVTSARALAMGNAFICKVDDPWAAFYNPAGLGTVRKPTFHISNLHLEVNKGFLNLTQGSISDTFSKASDNFSADGIRQNMAENPGTLSHAKFNFYPNFTMRYFTLGYFLSMSNRARLETATSDLEFAERRDHGPIASLNLSLFGGIFKLGASAAYLNRKQLQVDFAPTDTISIQDSDYSYGKALIVTAGSRITLPFSWLPTFAAVMRNTGETEFQEGKAGNPVPTDIPRTIDGGISITPQIGKRMRIHLEANYRDMTGEYASVSKKRKIGAGMEIDFARTFFIRFGYGDGFGSAGLGLQTRRFFFDLSTYAVDLSPTDIRGVEDRRFVFSMSSGF